MTLTKGNGQDEQLYRSVRVGLHRPASVDSFEARFAASKTSETFCGFA